MVTYKFALLLIGISALAACTFLEGTPQISHPDTGEDISEYVDGIVKYGHPTGDGTLFYDVTMLSIPDEEGQEYKGVNLPNTILSIQVDGKEIKTQMRPFFISESILVQIPGDQLAALNAKEVTFCIYDENHEEFLDHDPSNNCHTLPL